jgi:disulfide bond formation protein DsbB
MRVLFTLIFLACTALLGFGLYLQYAQGLEPCPLCLMQRGFFVLVAAVALLAALHNPRGWGRRCYGGFIGLFSIGGVVTAGRQVWLQHLPADQVPECGPDLEFMLEFYPLREVLGLLFRGSGECAEVDWTFLGLSIAEWSLICFVALLIAGLWMLFHRTPQRGEL